MQNESGTGTIEAMKQVFEKKYNEEISAEMLAQLALQYSVERVEEVISKMKPDAYNPANFLKRSLASGWYKENGKGRQNWQASKGNGSGRAELENTVRWIWNIRLEAKWVTREERDYMLDVLLNGTQPDEAKVREIWFKVHQGQYPNRPASWFYLLKWPENQQAANAWIERAGRSDIPLYDVPNREATIDELL